jgi:hypothetical protein
LLLCIGGFRQQHTEKKGLGLYACGFGGWFFVDFFPTLNMLPHPHGGGFNIEPCTSCEEKLVSHTGTGVEKRCKPKTQPPSIAVLWKIKSRHTHIKTKNLNLQENSCSQNVLGSSEVLQYKLGRTSMKGGFSQLCVFGGRTFDPP